MTTREVYLVKRLRTLSERPLTGSWYSSEIKEAAATIEALTRANAEMREALEHVRQWAEAYPVEMFTPLSDGEVKIAGTVLKSAGIEIGALHAGWARHILSGIGDYARAALARKP